MTNDDKWVDIPILAPEHLEPPQRTITVEDLEEAFNAGIRLQQAAPNCDQSTVTRRRMEFVARYVQE